MFTAYLYERETKPLLIGSYQTIDEAVDGLVNYGWEDDLDRLLKCPIVVYDQEDRVASILTYSYNLAELDAPFLHVYRVDWEISQTYRRMLTDDSYVAELCPDLN